jgi:hypothetical protein
MPADLAAILDIPELRAYRIAREKAPNWRARQLLEMNSFNGILHAVFDKNQSAGKKDMIEIDEELALLSVNLIEHHPVAYLGVVAENIGAWTEDYAFGVAPYVDHDLLAEYSANWSRIIDFYKVALNQGPGVTLDAIKKRLLVPSLPAPAYPVPKPWRIPIKIIFLVATLVSGLSLVSGRAGAATAFIAYVGVSALGGALLVAMSTVFIPRYAIPLDPLVLIVVVLGTWRAPAWKSAAFVRPAAGGSRRLVPATAEPRCGPAVWFRSRSSCSRVDDGS